MSRPFLKAKSPTLRYSLNKALEGHPNQELASFFAHSSQKGVESGLIEFASRVCYNSTAKLGASPNFVRDVLDSGHMSVAEHPNIAVHLKTLLDQRDFHSMQNTFLYFTKYNRYFDIFNNYMVGNFRCWIEVIREKGATFKNFEEVIAALPEAFDTTPIFPEHALDFVTFRNFINVPTYEDESGLKVSLLAANVDLTNRKISAKTYTTNWRGSYFGRFSWLVEGISRNCANQIARHRGASISQESQRYVDATKHPQFVYPPHFSDEQKAALADFNMRSLEEYKRLREKGAKKEDARFVLPGGIATRMVLSFNSPELYHFLKLRCAKDAQWEVRRLAMIMAQQSVLALPSPEIEEIMKWKES